MCSLCSKNKRFQCKAESLTSFVPAVKLLLTLQPDRKKEQVMCACYSKQYLKYFCMQVVQDWCGEATLVFQLNMQLLVGMVRKAIAETLLTFGLDILCLTMKVTPTFIILFCCN